MGLGLAECGPIGGPRPLGDLGQLLNPFSALGIIADPMGSLVWPLR